MSEKTIGVAPDRVFGLQTDYSKKAHIAINQNDEQFFDAFEAFLKANYQQKEVFIEEVLKRKSSALSFVVGQVFQHRAKGLVPQYHGDNFKNWLWTPARARVISIGAFGKNNLKEYVLPKNMNDTTIKINVNSSSTEEDQFWAMLYLLIVKPKLGKKFLKYVLRKDKIYIFHVKLASGMVVAVDVRWFDGEWDVRTNDFDCGNPWNEGIVFLYPVSA